MAELQEIRLGLDDVLDRVVNEAKNNLQNKGHVNTGRLLASVEKRVKQEGNAILGLVEFLDYGVTQDTGLPKGSPEFQKSSYINGLIQWVKNKGFGAGTEQKAKSIAFAIKRTHQNVGMHSSKGFPNPEAKGWFTEVVDRLEPEIEKVIEKSIENNFEVLIDAAIRDVR